MIQDCTRVLHFARAPPLPPTPPRGFAHCTVPFLPKNPAHKQDKWFKNNLHNEKKRGRGWTTGRKEEAGWGHASFHLSCQLRVAVEAAVPAAFDLCKAPGVWICPFIHNDLDVSFHTQWSQEEEEKETPCPMRRDESCEGKKPISCVASSHHSCHPAPRTVKNRTVDRGSYDFWV